MVVFTFLYLLWGTRTGTCHGFVYLFFLGNPLGVLGHIHIIHHWKGIHEEIAAPLEFYLYTGHKFLCTISSTSVTIKKSPLSNFRIVSEQGRTRIFRLRIGSCVSLQRELQL